MRVCDCRRHGIQPSRRCFLIGAASVAVVAGFPAGRALARAVREPARTEDEKFMRLALAEAAKGDFPFGTVIVIDGEVAATGRNLGKTNGDPTAHGEMTAIRAFVAKRRASDLRAATLYTTGEPCPMCMSAIIWCGVKRVVYAASIAELSARIGQIEIPSATVAEATPFETVAITGGVLAADALALFPKP
ncbi:MAG TPA: nucleoside deaminase [Methylocystis sp.]|nr:nucleoside deaminase [Methylocystis sp.]HXZ15332.1 nucleoside deaminase [Roseiarcus sp.]